MEKQDCISNATGQALNRMIYKSGIPYEEAPAFNEGEGLGFEEMYDVYGV